MVRPLGRPRGGARTLVSAPRCHIIQLSVMTLFLSTVLARLRRARTVLRVAAALLLRTGVHEHAWRSSKPRHESDELT